MRVCVGLCRRLDRRLDVGRVRVAVGGLLGGPEGERHRPLVGLVRVVGPVVGEVPHRSDDPAADEDGELDDRGLAPERHGRESLPVTGRRGSWRVRSLMLPIDGNHGRFCRIRLTGRAPEAQYSAFVMTTRTPTRPGVLSSVGVRLSLRVLLLLGILPGGFVI